MLGGQSYLGKGIGWLPTLGGVPQPTSNEEFTKQVSVTVCQSAGKGCNLKIYSGGRGGSEQTFETDDLLFGIHQRRP